MTQASATQQLQIQLFETFTLSANGTALKKLNQRERCQSLLGYLIIHSGQDVPRSKLAFQLWPDSSDSQALTNLRRELHYLKRDLPGYETCLSISNKTLRWNPEAPCTIDVSEFETALQQAQLAQQAGDQIAHCDALEQAAQHYQGQLLPHLYDEWIPPEQERLQQLAIQGLLGLVEGLQQQVKYRTAIRYAQQVLRLDNLNEAGHIHLIQLHALSGDRATALRLYHHCMTLFIEELGVDPSAALQKVYDDLLNEPGAEPTAQPQLVAEAANLSASGSSAQPPVPSATETQTAGTEAIGTHADITRTDWGAAVDTSLFYGRQDELKTLTNWVDGDSSGSLPSNRCRLIAILAMGGMGKTMLSVKLAEQMAEQLSPNGAPTFDCVMWRSLRYATPFNDFAKDLLGSLSNQTETQPSPARLAHWLRESRCLIVLDNLETILQGGEEAGYFRPGYEGYGEMLRLFAEGSHQSCLILTSREKPAEVGAFEGMDLPVRSLQLQGSAEVAEAILQTKGLVGSVEEKRQLSDRYDNIPLAIKIIASSIQELFDGEIQPFLAEDAFLFNGLRRLLDQQFERLSPLEQSIMFWLAINHEGTTISDLAEDLIPKVPRANILSALKSLRWRSLLQKQQGLYNQQPAITEYVLEKLVTQVSEQLDQTPDTPESWNSNPLHSHALLKATAQDYLQDLQRQLILRPIVHRLQSSQGNNLPSHLQQWVEQLQLQAPGQTSYAPGNLINLLSTAQIDLTGWDFSTLQIRQAQLQNLPLHQVNFSHCDLKTSAFATTLSAILDLDWSPDGELLATADVEGQVRLWQAQDGQLLQAFTDHGNWVHCLAFSPDGQQIASGSEDAEIFLWDVQTGEILKRLLGHDSRVWSVAFQPLPEKAADTPLLASGSEDGTVRLWNLNNGETLQKLAGHQAGVNAVTWISDRQFISASSDKTLRLWSIGGDCLAILSGHEKGIWSLAVHRFGNSGPTLIASGSQDGVIRLWLLPAALQAQESSQENALEPFAKLQTQSRWIWSLRFDGTGQCLASGHDDGCIYLWQTGLILKQLLKSGPNKTMQVQLQGSNQVLKGHQSRVWGLAFNPGGKRLVSGSKDQSMHFWDLERRVSLRTLKGYTNWVQAIAISPQGTTLLSAHEDTAIRQWDLETGELRQVLQGHSQPVWAIAISPDGKLCASSGEDETVNLWDVEQGKLQATLPGKQGRIWATAFSQDGQLLAFGGGGDVIRMWDLKAQAFQPSLRGHSSRIWSIAFSPDGQQLASSSSDGSVRLWSIATGECLATLTGHKGWVFSVAWSPDGATLVSSGSDGTLRLWDSTSHEALATLPSKTKLMLSAQFSPDGSLIASGSDDNLVRLWNVETQKCILVYQGHQGWVWSVAFSPDGKTLCSGSQDTTVQQWDIETGKRLLQLRPTRPYEGMELSGATGLTPGQQETLVTLGAILE